MRFLFAFVAASFSFLLVAMAEAQSGKSLTAYVYVRTARYESAEWDFRYAYALYPDGLLQSAQFKWLHRSSHSEQSGGSFRVFRDGKVIRKESTGEDGVPRTESYDVGSDSIVIRRSDSKSLDTVKISPQKATGAIVYEYSRDGVLFHQYVFAPDGLTIREFPAKRTLTCSLDRVTGLPLMTSTSERTIGSNIRFGRTQAGDVFAIYRDADGPLLASYRFEGSPMHASPLITVLNCEIGLDWLHGVLLPFIGGTPAQ